MLAILQQSFTPRWSSPRRWRDLGRTRLAAVPLANVPARSPTYDQVACGGATDIAKGSSRQHDLYLKIAARERGPTPCWCRDVTNLCLVPADFGDYICPLGASAVFGGATMPIAPIERMAVKLPSTLTDD